MDSLWRTSLERIQERFSGMMLAAGPLSCYLVQTVELRQTDIDPGEPYELNRPPRVGGWGKSGASLEATPLVSEDGYILTGDTPIKGPDGTPYLAPSGEPVAWELGFRRDHSFYSHKPTSFQSYEPSAREAGQTLRGIPASVRGVLWKNLPPRCHCASDPVNLWTDAIFELAWQGFPGTALTATTKSTWFANWSIPLDLLPLVRTQMPQQMPSEISDCPEYWYSHIDDVFSASVAAIDILLALPSGAANESKPSKPSSSDTLVLPSDPITMHEMATLGVVEIKTVRNWGTSGRPKPAMPQHGRRAAVFSYRELRPWFIGKQPDKESFWPEDYKKARATLAKMSK